MTALSRFRFVWTLAALAAIAGLAAFSLPAMACPFCSAVSLTFSEEIDNSQVAVIGKLVQTPPRSDDPAAALDVAKAKFEIIEVLKGEDELGSDRKIEVVYFGDSPLGAQFLIMGIDPPNINWGTPIAISERGIEYVVKSLDLPKEGPDRLAFFQEYFEDGDEMLTRDAYDEFAKAPYADVQGLKDRMHHDKLIEWVQSSEVPVSRRRLYLTMLGVCGKPDDVPILEDMIQSKDRQTKGALDALVACYLTLKGPAGMPLIEELFLKNQDAEYTDTYATIMALRFHGTEEDIIPRERLLVGLRMMLDRPQLADLVIPDLARWDDWSVMDKLVELFKTSNEESSWVRVPVINYLRACPLPEAKGKLDELAQIDPESIKRANSFFPLGTAPVTEKPDENSDSDQQADTKPSPDQPPADETPAVQEPAGEANSGDAGQSSAAPPYRAKRGKTAEARESAVLAGPLAPNAAEEPGPPVSSLAVFGGLTAAVVLLTGAFLAILKGGKRAAE